MPIKDVIKETAVKMEKAVEAADREFSEVRTGRAHPGLVEGLHVDYFGTPTLIKQLANITVPDPRTIVIQPWDPTVIPEIEKAISNAVTIGINPQNDGKVIRLNVPTLSDERRAEMAKVVKDMAEKSRVAMRTIRREANEKLKKLESDKHVGEDEAHKAHDDVQKLTDKYIKEIEVLLDEKTKALISH